MFSEGYHIALACWSVLLPKISWPICGSVEVHRVGSGSYQMEFPWREIVNTAFILCNFQSQSFNAIDDLFILED